MRKWLAQHLAVSIALAAGLGLLVTVGAWVAVVVIERSDTDRCRVVPGASADSVGLAWLNPDECSYIDDETGKPVYPDARFAGPVQTTPFRDAAAVGLACTLLAGGALVADARMLTRREGVA